MHYTIYYKTMLTIAAIFLLWALINIKLESSIGVAICFSLAFVFWFGAIMAPNNQKYKN